MSDGQHSTAEEQAHAFTAEVCKGNQDAMVFCNLFYRYAHFIDDAIDLKEDGRITLSNEKILEMFAVAAMVFNCGFYVQHRAMLFPTILTITNMYADSVAWEKSPLKHRRLMADAMRTCGDEVFFMVALIVGGWQHMRSVSLKIRDADWIKQHDSDGNPI